jgi:hypothetical protein
VQKRLKLRDGRKRPWRLDASGQHVVGTDPLFGDATLQVADAGEDELLTRHCAYQPLLRRLPARCRRVDLELEPAIGALDSGATLGNQSVIELVFSAAAATSDIHAYISRVKT